MSEEIRLIARPGAGAVYIAALIAIDTAATGKRVLWLTPAQSRTRVRSWLDDRVEVESDPRGVGCPETIDLMVVDGEYERALGLPDGARRTLFIEFPVLSERYRQETRDQQVEP